MKEFQENYYITTNGDVYSSKRHGKLVKLKTHKRKDGYVNAVLNINGKKICRRVHRLVAEAFIQNPDCKPQVNHIDGDKSNNNVSNLEWCTASENLIHAYKNGLACISKANKESTKRLRKLSFDDANEIRKRYVPRCSENGLRALAREFGIDKQGVKKILDNKTYVEDKE